MAIDIAKEHLISIAQAAVSIPGSPHQSTVWRWAYCGCRGTKLDTITVGGKRFTSSEAVQRFIEATNTIGPDGTLPPRSRKQRHHVAVAV